MEVETPVVRSRGRPRKRRREDSPNVGNNVKVVVEEKNDGENVQNAGNVRKRGRPPKKRVVEVKGEAMVGRYVMKEFEGNGVFLGKIVSYDSGLYRVDYEDGDFEDLDSGELREFLIRDELQRFVGVMLERKKKLDEAVKKKRGVKSMDESVKGLELEGQLAKADVVDVVFALERIDATKMLGNEDDQIAGHAQIDAMKVGVPIWSEVCDKEVDESEVDGSEDDYVEDDDEDSCSDSSEYGQGWETRAETEVPATPPPELPPSSGTIGIPEEYVSHFFSVYGFLRTFSVQLFLSPFTLDDLVGCLRCTTPNTLLDAIHVALLRALRKHFESLASEGSQLASKCLRSVDWSLIDILTWPVYLVHYLMLMGHLNEKEWKDFYAHCLEKDYCTLSIGTKLTVLQILCDDALDSEEIRAEIDTREESEVGVDSDGISINPLESGPRNLLPRYSSTSISKDSENVNLDAENTFLVSSKAGKDNYHKSGTKDVGEDGNRDECRLCGMEGMLVCCDGCPSAYHTRCIGVNKLSIPDGEWFCPECTISKLGPPITQETLLRGAELFGVDSYSQLFLGTCSHLLVLKVSVKTSYFVRYYNWNDIPKVLTALNSSPDHAVSYWGICQAISRYWELPQVIIPPVINNQMSMAPEYTDKTWPLSVQSHPLGEIEFQKALHKVEHENGASTSVEDSVHAVPGLGTENIFIRSGAHDVSLAVPKQIDIRTVPGTSIMSGDHNSTAFASKISEQAEVFQTTPLGQAARLSTSGTSCSPGYNSNINAGQMNGVCLPRTQHVPSKKVSTKAGRRTAQTWKDACLYTGSIFKPFAYINNYVHGDFAASAAANFAALSSDENRASEIHASDPRKAMAANISLQVKAFSSAAIRFFWPSTEKKLIEIPRERCSWCFHCEAPVMSRKACLLNAAALNATRGEMRFISGLRLVKNVEGGLYGIAAYTLYMEESLRGLIVGPFRNSNFLEHWRKKVEQASTCLEMKSLVLDLEKNLCAIALSSEWTKLVDNWMDESSVPQTAAATGSTLKRGTGRRKKHLAIQEITADESNDSKESVWWRGGKLAKLVFQRGAFPCPVLRKAARQGGSGRLPGIYYADESDVPKRSRQFIWRAAVEMAKNASQLALQVRYLDQYIKWSELARPEQNPSDGKGPETEAFAFRNAQICDKKVSENKLMYGVVFGHQKHLSTRLMKSIIEKEEIEDGKDKYWFLESRIPLYLIKEYEESIEKSDSPLSEKPVRYTKHQKRQLKASRREIMYLIRKSDGLLTCACASCRGDVLLEHAVTCKSCEGFCHQSCTFSSTAQINMDTESVTCKQCSRGKFVSQANGTAESPTSPLALQGQEFQNSTTAAKGRPKNTGQQCQNSNSLAKSLRSKKGGQQLLGSQSDKKATSSDSNLAKSKKRSSLHMGLIWKKKGTIDGSDFRLNKILFRGSPEGARLNPECLLCHKPYSPHLMYIFCDTCENWYHADAVGLDESKLPQLVGYKCCRCRRIRSPLCPYADPETKKTEVKKLRIRGPKEEMVEAASASEAFSEQAESLPSTPMSFMEMEEDVFIDVNDPLLLPVSQVEQMPEPKAEQESEWITSGPGPQKLPVRRHIKNEIDDIGLVWDDLSSVQLPTSAETKDIAHPQVQWDISNAVVDDGNALNYETFSYENADFEPQTYFSFTELLEADEGNKSGGIEASGDGWDNLHCDYSQSGFMEQCDTGSLGDYMPTSSTDPAVGVRCEVCQVASPVPDLMCQNCCIQMHSQCSPWDEAPQAANWYCGPCRGWS